MKHRQIFSILLALALLCALTVPALAAGTAYEDFLADFDRWWAEKFPNETVEQYGQDIGISPDEVRQAMYGMWKAEQDYAAWKSEYLAANPGLLEGLRAGAYTYFERNSGFDSVEEYLETYHVTEEQFPDLMAEEQLRKFYDSFLMQRERERFITEHGGTPGQLNVMVNGKCLSFPADRPAYMENGVTYVDAAALSRALGTEVAADEKGYAPLRPAAESLGCKVFWDDLFHTAVVLDPDAIIAEIDKDFTLYNRIYSNGYDGYWTLTGKAKANFTFFDTMTGNRTAAATGSADLVISEDGFSGTVQYDLDKAFQSGLPKPALLPAKETIELRMNKADSTLWFRAPDFNEALAGNGANITRDGWLPVSVDELLNELPLLEQFFPQNKTMGERICAQFADGTVSTIPAYEYDLIMNTARNWTENMGDAQFTRKGNAYILTPEALTEYAPISGLYQLRVSQESQTITLKDNGDVDIDTKMRMVWDDYEVSLGDVAEQIGRAHV